MAKKGSPQKRSIRCEKDHPGCMWGLLRIFDLRHRHPVRRLVSERRQSNSRHAVDVEYSKRMLNLLTEFNDQHNGIDATNHNLSVGKNLNESTATKFDSWGASVKTLIAEEMSKEPNSKRINSSNMIECPRSFLEQGNYLEKKLEATLTCRVSCDSNFHGLEYSEFGRSSHPNLTQTAPVEMPCHQDLQEKLGEAVEAFLNQKFINAMCLSSDGTHQSKEMMDALEILNSNKELFLRLLQDPNSLLVKHIQRLQDAQTEKLCRSPCRSLAGAESSEKETSKPEQSEDFIIHEPFQKHNSHRFFRKRDKSRETKPPKENKSQKSTSIVVLKPNTARIQNTETAMGSSSPQSQYNFGYKGESERVGSNFSLKEIKRKLKQAIGESRKERERISKDGVLDRIPYGHLDPGDPKISIAAGKRSNTRKLRTSQTSIDYDIDLPSGTNNLENLINLGPRESVESVVSREAKKHIAEKLGPEGEDLRTRQVTRPLGRILSLPEYKLISPGSSPARELEPTFFSDQIRFSSRFGLSQREKTFHCSSPLRQNIESSASRVNLDGGKQNGFCIRGDSSPEGVIETEMANNVQKSIEENEPCVVPSEPDDEILVIANCVEERSTETIESGCSGSDIFGEKPSLDSPAGFISSSALLAHEIESSDMIEKLERPSPISVLEPMFSEDVISPASSMSLHEFPIAPRCIHFEESALSPRGTTRFLTTLEPEIDPCFFTDDDDKEAEFDYVSTVLEASGLSGNELLGRWHSSDEPLGPSLFDIVEGFPDQFSNNRKLLFDCINQVLMEVSMQFSGYAPWISLVKPKTRPVPLGKNLVQEVWAGISWHLSMQSQSPRTLDQIVERDMEKRGSWMDLQSEAECLGVEMEETILEDLVNETILELGI